MNVGHREPPPSRMISAECKALKCLLCCRNERPPLLGVERDKRAHAKVESSCVATVADPLPP